MTDLANCICVGEACFVGGYTWVHNRDRNWLLGGHTILATYVSSLITSLKSWWGKLNLPTI